MFGWNLNNLIWGNTPTPIEPPKENFHKVMREFVRQIQIFSENFLQNNLDEFIYEKEFIQANKDNLARYICEEKQIENLKINNIKRYKLFINLLIDTQSLLLETEALHNYSQHGDSSFYLLVNGLNAKNRFFGLLKSYTDVYKGIIDLGIDNFFTRLTENFSFETVKALTKENTLITIEKTTNILAENFFYNSLIYHYDEWTRILDASINWLESIDGLLKKFVDETQQTSIQETLNAISNLIISIKRFSKTNQSRTDLLIFIYKISDDVVNLLHNFPLSCIELQNDLHEHVISTAEQLNAVLKDICLQLDKKEIELYLRESFFVEYEIKGVSINKLALKLHEWIKSIGYDFKNGNRYPYLDCKHIQRERLILDHTIDKELLYRRIQSVERQIAIANRQIQEEEKIQTENRNTIRLTKTNHLINHRIKILGEEYQNSHETIKLHKITLLKLLQKKLNRNVNIEVALDQLEVEPEISSLPALFQGRTGKTLNQLRNTLADKFDRLYLIEAQLSRLVKEKANMHCGKTKIILNKRILNLKLLKYLLAIPGFTLEDAKTRICAKYHDDYKILQKYDDALLKQLNEYDQAISVKKTELLLNDNEEIRTTLYPKHLQPVTKIREVEEIEGTSYREIYFDKLTPSLKENNIHANSLYAIKNIYIKGINPKISYNAESMLGRKIIDSHDNVTVVAHRLLEKLENKHDESFDINTLIHMRLMRLREKRQNNFKFFSRFEPQVANRIGLLTKVQNIISNNLNLDNTISDNEKTLLIKFENAVWMHPQLMSLRATIGASVRI